MDLAQGQPPGHAWRSCILALRIARQLELDAQQQFALYHAMLLKDLGVTSYSAQLTYLFGGDDHGLQRALRSADGTKLAQRVSFCWQHQTMDEPALRRLSRFASLITANAPQVRELWLQRCAQGAKLVSTLRLPAVVAETIASLDAHWDGQGIPTGRTGDAIPLLSRIGKLAEALELHLAPRGKEVAVRVVTSQGGRQFDPSLVRLLPAIAADTPFWHDFANQPLTEQVRRCAPQDAAWTLNTGDLLHLARVLADFVDAKSPWTYLHSRRVAEIAVGMASELGCSLEVQQDIEIAALLHDLGKVGTPNTVLDKAGRPTREELVVIRRHPAATAQLLERIPELNRLASAAAAHHERLDGRGYHLGLTGDQIPWVGKILAVADIFEALTARRPYRDALSVEQTHDILVDDAGLGVDPVCLAALFRWYEHSSFPQRVDKQLSEVERVFTTQLCDDEPGNFSR
jgi:putative nucleotidyltransferase with HDIG domain